MKKLYFVLFLLMVSSVQAARTKNPFIDYREGPSRFITEENSHEVDAFAESYGTKILSTHVKRVFSDIKNQRCASRIVDQFRKFPGGDDPHTLNMIILQSRKLGLYDDIVTELLIKMSDLPYRWTIPAPQDDGLSVDAIKGPYKTFVKKLGNDGCIEASYYRFVSKMKDAGFDKIRSLRATNHFALKNNLIDKKTYKVLESLRVAKVDKLPMTLNEYRTKLISVRRQAKIKKKESSNFITKELKRKKMSIRQRMYYKFSYMQILMMGKLITDLRKRMEADNIAVHISYKNESEIIPLEPMEKFRFILKLLRKEKSKLNAMKMFEENYVSYDYLIAAAYEVGKVPAIEIEELASLEEIWNPKLSKTEKMMFWVRIFGSVSASVVSSAYSFLPILAVTVIEGAFVKEKPHTDTSYNIF